MFTPSSLQKSLARFFSSFCFFSMLLGISLHAETIAIDPIDQEFSGPLAVIPEMVTVGDPGNPADPATGLGAVQDTFQMGKYPVTQLQWSTFLNAVHVVEGNLLDPRNLYHSEMFRSENPTSLLTVMSGIFRKSAKDADSEYNFKIDEEKVTFYFPQNWGTPQGHAWGSLPMTGISIDDCKRYANWLHNGAPSFNELNDTTLAVTETGAYDFTNGKNGELMPGARFFIPTLNQWYKAAYYQAGSSSAGYWKYPTQGDTLPFETPYWSLFLNDGQSKTGANFATIGTTWPHPKFYYFAEQIRGTPLTTPVGAFKNSPGPYGTFDMGGNVRQWTSGINELDRPLEGTLMAALAESSVKFMAQGGSYDETSDQLLSTNVLKSFSSTSGPTIGLRICAQVEASGTANQLESGSFTSDSGKSSLIARNLLNVATAQLTAYGLEASITTGRALVATGAIPELSAVIAPFTYQRNLVNAILTVALATSTTGEASCMNINKADYWTVAMIAASTIVTMICTEGSAFVVEAAVGKVLAALSEYGFFMLTVKDSVESLAWPRIFTNVWYIGCNTYLTTQSDLDYFNAEQRLQLPASSHP